MIRFSLLVKLSRLHGWKHKQTLKWNLVPDETSRSLSSSVRSLLQPIHRRAPSKPLLKVPSAEVNMKDETKISRTNATSKNLAKPIETEEKNEKFERILTLPTVLTMARVVAIPLLATSFYMEYVWSPVVCTTLFVAASITDWLDGYLARKMNTFSSFGAFLDPVADKLMVATALILISSSPVPHGLLEANRWILPMLSIIIIGREITMSSLREWAARVSKEAYKAVAVSSWGKVKTALQMSSIVLLLLSSDSRIPHIGWLTDTGLLLLSIAAYLSLHSLALYFKSMWKFM